jgi:hypothetical protein
VDGSGGEKKNVVENVMKKGRQTIRGNRKI